MISAYSRVVRELPEEQDRALKKAVRLEWLSIAFTSFTVTIVFFVLGNSQAMKTAWVEDMLSTTPQIAFLVAVIFIGRKATKKHPYGYHRAMGVGHLVAGVALVIVATNLIVEAVTSLVSAEHPTIGTVLLWGHTVWLGWLMMGVMALIATPPVLFGRAKKKIAPKLHNKLLYADADMSSADWTTNVGSIVGVAGIGIGLWWLDSAAALFIAGGILWDGLRNTKSAVLDLMDQRATTYDQKSTHPIIGTIHEHLLSLPWVVDVGSRAREVGQVLHVETFVVLTGDSFSDQKLHDTAVQCQELDWRVEDLVLVPVMEVPEYATTPSDAESQSRGQTV